MNHIQLLFLASSCYFRVKIGEKFLKWRPCGSEFTISRFQLSMEIPIIRIRGSVINQLLFMTTKFCEIPENDEHVARNSSFSMSPSSSSPSTSLPSSGRNMLTSVGGTKIDQLKLTGWGIQIFISKLDGWNQADLTTSPLDLPTWVGYLWIFE